MTRVPFGNCMPVAVDLDVDHLQRELAVSVLIGLIVSAQSQPGP